MAEQEYNIIEPRKPMRKILTLIGMLLLLLALTLSVYFFTKVNKAASEESNPITFVIAPGTTTKQIAAQLEENNIINNPTIFTVYVLMNNASGKIQAGEYILDRTMSIEEIVDVITVGKVVREERKLTIIEGWSNKQIASYLQSRNIVSANDFNKSLANASSKFTEAKKVSYEGFLFPDTYTVSKSPTADEIVSRMLNNFENKLTDKMITDIQKKNMSVFEVITLASIVEKEVGRNKQTITDKDRETMQHERELVASVFHNRLEINMALESDATVNYVTGKADRQALISDTKIQSPYNTYQVRGLPPGPISNPGIDAIMAAIYPAESDYLFFLNDTEGVAYFGKTLAEHNANRAKYLD